METANVVDIYIYVCVFLKQTTFIQSNTTYVLF